MRTVIVYGPPGSGKTRNAEALMKHFGCDSLHDELWEGSCSHNIVHGGLHLTQRDLSLGLGKTSIETYHIDHALSMLREAAVRRAIAHRAKITSEIADALRVRFLGAPTPELLAEAMIEGHIPHVTVNM